MPSRSLVASVSEKRRESRKSLRDILRVLQSCAAASAAKYRSRAHGSLEPRWRVLSSVPWSSGSGVAPVFVACSISVFLPPLWGSRVGPNFYRLQISRVRDGAVTAGEPQADASWAAKKKS